MTVSLVIALHHISLVVSNTTRSVNFYRDVLGLEPLDSRPDLSFDGAWLDLGQGQQIHLLEVENPDPVTGRPAHGGRDRHLALSVSDLASIVSRLEGLGIPYGRSASGREAIFFRDPDGNALELLPA